MSDRSHEVGTSLGEQLPENRAMTALLLLAVAPDGEGRVMGECGQQIENSRGIRQFHLGVKAALESLPRPIIPQRRLVSELQQLGTGSEIGEPQIVEVTLGDLCLRDSPRRSPDSAQPQPLMGLPG